jgi:hypothetical protein
VALYKDSISTSSLVADTVASSWSFDLLADGLYIIAQTDSGGLWLRANGNHTMNDTVLVLPNTTVSDTFINRYYGVSVALADFWNIVSAPVVLKNYSITLLYPGAEVPAYRFDTSGSYVSATVLNPGKGYWAKFGPAHNGIVLGAEATDDTVSVAPGWNMIGSISTPLVTGDIIQDPADNIVSHLFTYGKHGYEASDTLQSGKGYWVNVSQSGTLELKKPAGPHAARKTPSVMDKLNVITISDKNGGVQKLFFGRNDETDASNPLFLMPPAPPAGTFDARFASGRIAEIEDPQSEGKEVIINISSAAYPVTVGWNVIQDGSGDYTLTDNHGGALLSTALQAGEGAIAVKDAKIRSLVLKNGTRFIPQEYALAQNYPNPFNPATSIRYQLPVDSRVTLKIFNVVGQEIKTLVNGAQSAGYKSVRWNGTDNAMAAVPSGLYFYRLEAADAANPDHSFTQVKKMMLLK